MTGQHSTTVRGLAAAGKSKKFAPKAAAFNGRFGRLFPDLPKAVFGASEAEIAENLTKLANAMISPLDLPKDAPDDEESGIPALFTYFGQFIDHDLTFDPNSSFEKHKDPDATTDFRTPAFDLDNIYGRGPGDQPYMYGENGKSLLLGDPLTQGKPAGAHDLQRNGAGRALIGDPRNDENAIVSQLQGLVLRFHNRMVKQHPHEGFAGIQKLVRHHYQYVVVNDFLPRIVHETVLESLKTGGKFDQTKLKFFTNFDSPFLPIEFSTAAYRLGHSMIRPGYRLNDAVLLPIFPIPLDETLGHVPQPEGLTGFRRLVSDWALDWGRFIDIDKRAYGTAADSPTDAQVVQNNQRLQFAYRIDTALVDPLKHLPPTVASNPDSLALRNLLRGVEFGLPTGQAVAALFGEIPLSDKQILIGQGVDHPDPVPVPIDEAAGEVFAGNCPLWTYILAEAMQNQVPVEIPVTEHKTITTPRLGPVGGRIVAEVFLGLMFADRGAYLATDPGWAPPAGAQFGLKEFVEFALG